MNQLIVVILVLFAISLIMLCFKSKYTTFQDDVSKTSRSCSCGSKCNCNKINRRLVSLWVDHFIYTRLAMMAYFKEDKELKNITERLIKNQHDIGNELGKTFGKEVGEKISEELIKHINLAVEIMTDIAVSDFIEKPKKKIVDMFYSNGRDIGKYLDHLYGTTSTKKFEQYMLMHVNAFVELAKTYYETAYTDGKGDIQDLDEYLNCGMDMAYDMASMK